MQHKKRPTLDRHYLRLSARIARTVPPLFRKPYVRFVRALPRPIILAVAFTVLGGLAVTGKAILPTIFEIQGSANAIWSNGQYIQAAHFEGIVIQGALMATMLALLGAYATTGFLYVWNPKPSMRRTMLRIFVAAMVSAGAVFLLVPVNAATSIVSDAATRRDDAEYRVVHDWNLVSPETAARILADERAGTWFATPVDGPIARDIKTELREGSRNKRLLLVLGLQAEAKWKRPGRTYLE